MQTFREFVDLQGVKDDFAERLHDPDFLMEATGHADMDLEAAFAKYKGLPAEQQRKVLASAQKVIRANPQLEQQCKQIAAQPDPQAANGLFRSTVRRWLPWLKDIAVRAVGAAAWALTAILGIMVLAAGGPSAAVTFGVAGAMAVAVYVYCLKGQCGE